MQEPRPPSPVAAVALSFLVGLALLTTSCGVDQVAPGAQCFSGALSECAPGLECEWETDGSDAHITICSKKCEGYVDCLGVGFQSPVCKQFGLKSLCVEQEQGDAGASDAR